MTLENINEWRLNGKLMLKKLIQWKKKYCDPLVFESFIWFKPRTSIPFISVVGRHGT